jgi:hypothetical protein
VLAPDVALGLLEYLRPLLAGADGTLDARHLGPPPAQSEHPAHLAEVGA